MKRQSIAEQAQRYPAMVCNTVCHLIDCEFLRAASRQPRTSRAPGADQVTATQYAENLAAKRQDLHGRGRDHRYVAPPVERVWLEKDDGKQRPRGKPCCEDKRVQRAVVMILEAIFEHDFSAFSHGCRPGHSQHQERSQADERWLLPGQALLYVSDQKKLVATRNFHRYLPIDRSALCLFHDVLLPYLYLLSSNCQQMT